MIKEYKKLTELLNEYLKENTYWTAQTYELWEGANSIELLRKHSHDSSYDTLVGDFSEALIVSKKLGFVDWLIENNKMKTVFADTALVRLALSDKPLDDLIQLLK